MILIVDMNVEMNLKNHPNQSHDHNNWDMDIPNMTTTEIGNGSPIEVDFPSEPAKSFHIVSIRVLENWLMICEVSSR